MDPRRNLLARLLAGLQVGILSGLVTIAWFLALSKWYLSGPWTLLNLFSLMVRRGASWTTGFSMATIAGASLHLFACGVMGVFLGWILPRPRVANRLSHTGILFGIILSLMMYEFFWKRQLPPLEDHVGPGVILVAHLIVGLSAGLFPYFYLSLMPPVAEPEPVLELPVQD